jgi:hypothetical protein
VTRYTEHLTDSDKRWFDRMLRMGGMSSMDDRQSKLDKMREKLAIRQVESLEKQLELAKDHLRRVQQHL